MYARIHTYSDLSGVCVGGGLVGLARIDMYTYIHVYPDLSEVGVGHGLVGSGHHSNVYIYAYITSSVRS